MKKSINVLAALLAVQAILAVVLLTRQEPTATFTAKEPLVAISEAEVDKVVIESKESDEIKSLEMVKTDGVWLIPGYHNFPASETKVRDFLTTVAGFKKSWPVGKTKISAKQFKVVDDGFERRVTFFKAGKELSKLYLGSSPSFKKVHARVNDEDYTYSIGFNNHEAKVGSKDWINKKYLEQERAKVKSLELAGIQFNNQGGDFVIGQVPEGQETDRAKVNPIVSKAISPSFDEVLGPKEETQYGKQVFSYSVKVEDKLMTFEYYESLAKKIEALEVDAENEAGEKKQQEKLVLLVSDIPFAFEVEKNKIDSLTSVEVSQLVKSKEVENSQEKSDAEDGSKKDALNDSQSQRSSFTDDEDSSQGFDS